MSVPTSVDEPRRAVDQQTQPPQRALAFETAHDVIWQGNPLERRSQHELAGMKDERAPGVDLDQLRELLLRFLRVDERCRVVAEHPEIAIGVEIHRRRLDRGVPKWIDGNAARSQFFLD